MRAYVRASAVSWTIGNVTRGGEGGGGETVLCLLFLAIGVWAASLRRREKRSASVACPPRGPWCRVYIRVPINGCVGNFRDVFRVVCSCVGGAI